MGLPLTTIRGDCSPSPSPKPFLSLLDLAQRIGKEPELARVRNWFMIDVRPGIPLVGSDSAWTQAINFMGVPQEFIEQQTLITVTDLVLGGQAIFNPLRASRKEGSQ